MCWGHRSTFKMSVAGCLATTICSLAMTAGTASAQQRVPSAAPSGQLDHYSEMRERRQREAELRSIEMRLKETAKKPEPNATLEQADQDFNRILVLHNEIVRHISADRPLDYKIISDTTGEINKRANRLKKFLVPPDPEGGEKDEKERVELNSNQIKVALMVLCKRIERFVENPVFKVPGTIDAQEAAKAGGDLLRIIELSDNIKKDAGRLNKTLK